MADLDATWVREQRIGGQRAAISSRVSSTTSTQEPSSTTGANASTDSVASLAWVLPSTPYKPAPVPPVPWYDAELLGVPLWGYAMFVVVAVCFFVWKKHHKTSIPPTVHAHTSFIDGGSSHAPARRPSHTFIDGG
jgi:hypothetical protein